MFKGLKFIRPKCKFDLNNNKLIKLYTQYGFKDTWIKVQYKKRTIKKTNTKMVFNGVCIALPLQRSILQHKPEHDFVDARFFNLLHGSVSFQQNPKGGARSHPFATKSVPLVVVYFTEKQYPVMHEVLRLRHFWTSFARLVL